MHTLPNIKNGTRIPGKAHVYYFDGCKYPSVTTITHRAEKEPEGLRRWKENFRMPGFSSSAEYSKYAAIQGTFVHHAILNRLSPFPLDAGDLPAMDEWVQWGDKIKSTVQNAKRLWEQVDLHVQTPSNIETPLCHHEKWYAGQPDLFGKVKFNGESKFAVVDLKTSKQPYESHYRQVGAYTQMVNYTHIPAHHIEMGILIYLNAKMTKPRVEVIEKDELPEHINEFNILRDEFYRIPGIMNEYGIRVRD
jgi:hypothetical protein